MKKNLPMRDKVYYSMRDNILKGTYLPGARLTEEKLAADFTASRTPIREALRRLEIDKLVEYHPYRGVTVSEISKEELEDLYEIRAFLEGVIAKRAAQRATAADIEDLRRFLDEHEETDDTEKVSEHLERYNYAIVNIANCPHISEITKRIREILNRIIVATFTDPSRREIARKEHLEIVAAIEANDGALAQKLTVAHVKNAAEAAKVKDRI